MNANLKAADAARLSEKLAEAAPGEIVAEALRTVGRDQLAVNVPVKAIERELLRGWVLRESEGGSAVNMARELVEHNDQRDSPPGRHCPFRVELAAARALVQRAKLFPDLGVVLPPVAEPHLPPCRVERAIGAAAAEPKVEDLLDFVHELTADERR